MKRLAILVIAVLVTGLFCQNAQARGHEHWGYGGGYYWHGGYPHRGWLGLGIGLGYYRQATTMAQAMQFLIMFHNIFTPISIHIIQAGMLRHRRCVYGYTKNSPL